MLCGQCNQREGTTHVCSIVNDVKNVQNLCNECFVSSGTPASALTASMCDARCVFCGAAANIGGTDPLASSISEERIKYFCFGCLVEYNRYTCSCVEQLSNDLSEEQQLEVLCRLRQDAEKHMKDWLSQKPQ